MRLGEIVARAVTVGATPGRPASDAELVAAEARLGVRFNAQYREFMGICSGLEGLGAASLYPVEELGVSQRWLESTSFLEDEYFADYIDYDPEFDTRDAELMGQIFPPDRVQVLIGETTLVPSRLVCNFSASDPWAPGGNIFECRYEPELLGDLTETLTGLIDRAEYLAAAREDGTVESTQCDRADVYCQIHDLRRAISAQNPAIIRHALSARWRNEFDQHGSQAGLLMLRETMERNGTSPRLDFDSLEFDLWGSGPHTVRATTTFPFENTDTSQAVVLGVVKENSVWRIDSWSWSS